MEKKKKFDKKEYDKQNFKFKTVKFKKEEWKDIEEYCETSGKNANYLIRKAVMEYSGKIIE